MLTAAAGMLRSCIGVLMAFTLVLGVAYPLTVLAVAKLAFPSQAEVSLIVAEGKVIGSRLLGQSFTEPKYFWGRMSATTPPYNAAASVGSNLSPSNPKLRTAVKERVAALQKSSAFRTPIPIDLVTASASGLDPHITVDAANYQAERVARARQMKEAEVRRSPSLMSMCSPSIWRWMSLPGKTGNAHG